MQTAPGGGALAARVTASAAELLAKIALASSDGWPEAAGVAAQAECLAERAAPLAEVAARAYEEALAAVGDDYEFGRVYAKAAEPPLQIAEAAADVAELAALVAANGDPALRADAAVAGLIAAAAAAAAAELVSVNLTVSPGDERVRRAQGLAEGAARYADAARAARE